MSTATIIPIGTFTDSIGECLSQGGLVAGLELGPNGLEFVYDVNNSAKTQILPFPQGPLTLQDMPWAYRINEKGQVSGCFYHEPSSAVRGWAFDPKSSKMITLQPQKGGTHTYLWGLNDQGIAVGCEYDETALRQYPLTLDISSGAVQYASTPGSADRGGGYMDINASGLISGALFYNATPHKRACLVDKGNFVDISGGLRSNAQALNNQGQAIGWQEAAGGTLRAAWSPAKGQAMQLLDLSPIGNYPFSGAFAINNHGAIVGAAADTFEELAYGGFPGASARAFIVQNGVVQALNDFLPAGSGWNLVDAEDINDAGLIVGTGYFNGEMRGFVMSLTSRSFPEHDQRILLLQDRERRLRQKKQSVQTADPDNLEMLRLLNREIARTTKWQKRN